MGRDLRRLLRQVHPMTTGYERVVEELDARSLLVGWEGSTSRSALCPSHDDTMASLSIGEAEDGSALLYCHAGCLTSDVVEALGLSMADLFAVSDDRAVVAIYDYVDEDGNLLSRVMRTSPKGFYQERYEDGEWKPGMRDVRRVLYHLDELAAADPGTIVYFVEGEKDADNLRALGVLATTMLGGAGKWRDEYTPALKDMDVVIIPDADDPGRLGAHRVAAAVRPVAASVTIKVPAVGKDITDHLLAGLGLEDLRDEGDGLDEFGPLDWEHYEVEETGWLYEPYIPTGGRVLAYGPRGSLKSLWAMWVAAHLAKEGKKVAYFSLEMLPSDTARRLKQLRPPRENFVVYTRDLKLGSDAHTNKLIAGLKGFDLIVVDSWSAARSHAGRESNEDVADLDTTTFLPLIKNTGAALLLLDNVGHANYTAEGKHKPDHARGASAKGDKMEVEVQFERPEEYNNYRAKLYHRKMRLDYQMPQPVTVETPQDRIEFYFVEGGKMTGKPVWPSLQVVSGAGATPIAGPTGASASDTTTPMERRALARLKDSYKELADA